MKRLSTIELFKEDMKFSAGHFTIFSKEIRENLHGHNYNVHVSITTLIGDEGLSFDYRFYKEKFYKLCCLLNEIFLLPGRSKYLSITDEGDYYHVTFNNEKLIFLKRDVKILPIANVCVEELSNWFIDQVITDQAELQKNNVLEIIVKVFSGPGQSGSASWSQIGTDNRVNHAKLDVING